LTVAARVVRANRHECPILYELVEGREGWIAMDENLDGGPRLIDAPTSDD